MNALPFFTSLLAQAPTETIVKVTDEWSEVFFGFNQNQRFVLMIIAIGCLAGVICTIVGCLASTISSTQRQRIEAELKRDLIDQGMNAEEIARVVEAAPPRDFLERWAHKSSGRSGK